MSRCLGGTSVQSATSATSESRQVWTSLRLLKTEVRSETLLFLVGFGFGDVSCVSPDVLVRHKISLSYVRFCIMRSIVIAFTVKSKQSVKSS